MEGGEWAAAVQCGGNNSCCIWDRSIGCHMLAPSALCCLIPTFNIVISAGCSPPLCRKVVYTAPFNAFLFLSLRVLSLCCTLIKMGDRLTGKG